MGFIASVLDHDSPEYQPELLDALGITDSMTVKEMMSRIMAAKKAYEATPKNKEEV